MDTIVNTAAAKQRGTGRSVASWTFTNPEWVAPSEPTRHSTVDVRCDNALPGAPGQVGCVNLQAVPVISYSLTGPWPEVAQHIKDAQATGLPGKYGTNDYLTRLIDRKKIRGNPGEGVPVGGDPAAPAGQVLRRVPLRRHLAGRQVRQRRVQPPRGPCQAEHRCGQGLRGLLHLQPCPGRGPVPGMDQVDEAR